ncbi:hypothetical protein [Sphingomonas prati]|uniref:Uncharacterized protein n=1 Tax=Sphingomonas prati TaxID=1843237 RepID=A0A7W9F3S3_9SPHN|nr:hypothetical protein [Sphingomonas prati]MBB5730144.1 hypothetical protein [Sphingomonas prati]GGE91840.1 hypothetical protein GCM10011404_25940 [Sphingomonas prati]
MVSSHRHKWFSSILLFIGMIFGQPALAATTSVRILPDVVCEVSEGDDIRVCGSRIEREDVLRLHQLVVCIIKNQGVSSSAAVTAYIRTGDMARFRSVFASNWACSSARGLRVTAALLAGAFAEALLDRPMLSRLAKGQGGEAPASSAILPSDTLLHCVMRTGRVQAATFLRSQPYSRQERSAAMALGERLQGCVTTGDTIRTSVPLLRSMTALTFFAEKMAPVERTAPLIDQAQTERDARLKSSPPIAPPVLAIRNSALLKTPVLSIGRVDDLAATPDLGGYRHQSPDLPTEPDIADVMARDAAPPIDPDTGEPL